MFKSLSDVLARVGHVPTDRILVYPAPGTALEVDVFDYAITGERVCELIYGILVEKPMDYRDDLLATQITFALFDYLRDDNLGAIAGARGAIKFGPNLILIPDVTFIRWDSVEDSDTIENPAGECLEAVPDLVVEILSPGNTIAEMSIKLAEYSRAGVSLVWYVDREKKAVTVYPKGRERRKKVYGLDGTLDGGTVLPGFKLAVAKVFAKRSPPRKPGKKGVHDR